MEEIEIKVTNLDGFSINKILNNLNILNGNYPILNIDSNNFKGNNLRWTFDGCKNLKNINLNSISNNICNTIGMFNGCHNLRNINSLSNWNAFNVTDIRYMFCECNNLTTLNAFNWNFSNVINMYMIFDNCDKIRNIEGIENWNTINVTDMNSSFSSCNNLTNLNLSKWNTSNVTDMGQMFHACLNLQSINLSNWDTSNVKTMHSMFGFCFHLINLTINSNILFQMKSPSIFYETPIENGTGFVYVPENMVNQYKKATNWVQYANSIKSIEDDEPSVNKPVNPWEIL